MYPCMATSLSLVHIDKPFLVDSKINRKYECDTFLISFFIFAIRIVVFNSGVEIEFTSIGN